MSVDLNHYFCRKSEEMNNETITHPGVICNIGNDRIYVKILSQSACASCHAKGMCNLADMEEKVIDLKRPASAAYSVGDQVVLVMKRSLGTKAVILGYLIPFLILISALIILLSLTGNELFSALMAIGLLIPYYIILFILKDKLKKTFEFRIQG